MPLLLGLSQAGPITATPSPGPRQPSRPPGVRVSTSAQKGAIIGRAAIAEGLYAKQSEVHGMAQRGGAVQAHLRLSDQPIASDLIPIGAADLILSLEPVESLRYLAYLSPTGTLVTAAEAFVNIPDYPEVEGVLKGAMQKLLEAK